MAETPIKGVPILDVTESGCTPDGRYIWLHFKLPGGNAHNFLLDVDQVDKTIDMMRRAAAKAADLQAEPSVVMGADHTLVRPIDVKSIAVSTSWRHRGGVIFSATDNDNLSTALVLPLALARQLAAQLPAVVEEIATKMRPTGPRRSMH
ncbi:hypothetical protein [Vineibacter terrae]|uniref:hypothetical protein n=1 Tax=Vineibacter terrae TaxID=2586908 RepID=UPI002E33BDDA|nr:hypothetical protein [Vineibacter terrae]HEX2889295.1 hypothetical protein [Vineibacter terrae]